MTKFVDDYSGYQEHPRYGKGPRITGLNPASEPFDATIFLHWHSPAGVRIPNTAIPADTQRQLPATIPVTHYFDAKRVCRNCGTYFIFFAEEQKYWYEELKFPLEANMVDCIDCRKQEQRLQQARSSYEALLSKEHRSEAEIAQLVECGLQLVEAGIYSTKTLSKLRSFVKALDGPQATSFRQRIVSAEARANS